MLFMWNLNSTKLIVGKLFLLINYTFYNNLNITNFMLFMWNLNFSFVGSKLILLINYTFFTII